MSSHRKLLIDGYQLLTESRKTENYWLMKKAYVMIRHASLRPAPDLVRQIAYAILRFGRLSYPSPPCYVVGKRFRSLASHPNSIKRSNYKKGRAKAKRIAIERDKEDLVYFFIGSVFPVSMKDTARGITTKRLLVVDEHVFRSLDPEGFGKRIEGFCMRKQLEHYLWLHYYDLPQTTQQEFRRPTTIIEDKALV
jgi:hypothetical protein